MGVSDHLLHFVGIESSTKQGVWSNDALDSSLHLTLFYSRCISNKTWLPDAPLDLGYLRPQNYDPMNLFVINIPVCDSVTVAQNGRRHCS